MSLRDRMGLKVNRTGKFALVLLVAIVRTVTEAIRKRNLTSEL